MSAPRVQPARSLRERVEQLLAFYWDEHMLVSGMAGCSVQFVEKIAAEMEKAAAE